APPPGARGRGAEAIRLPPLHAAGGGPPALRLTAPRPGRAAGRIRYDKTLLPDRTDPPGGVSGPVDRIFCFAASYAVALALDVLYQFRPRPVVRLLSVGFGAAGLLAHTLYLAAQRPALAWQFGWMLFLAWILAIFYLYGTLHHGRLAWGVFVLPLVLGLVGLAAAFGRPEGSPRQAVPSGGWSVQDDRFWALLHAALLFLAAVGLCV